MLAVLEARVEEVDKEKDEELEGGLLLLDRAGRLQDGRIGEEA